jgi:hypothetical protein
MKKALIFAFSLLLIIACQKAENIFGIDPGLPDGTGAGNLPMVVNIDPANGAQMTDHDGTVSGIQGEFQITFSDYMDEATLTTANIEILNTTTNSTITGVTAEYFPEIRTLFIYIDELPSGSGYLLTLSGMTNRYGSPLEFDGDNFDDGTPYDDFLSTFWTTGITDTLVDITWPQIASVDPYLERTSDQQPVITIDFSNTGMFGMDDNTLGTSNFSLVNSSGTAYPLTQLSVSGSQVRFQPTGTLPLGDNYTLTITCSNIEKIVKSTTPDYLPVLDGNGNGPEATEPDTGGYFRVDTVIPPQVSVAGITGGAMFTFSRLIDETTIDLNSIRVFDDAGFVPGELRIYTDAGHNYTMVDYYFMRATSGMPDAFVSRDIKDATKDYYLDGDGNEIGGEPWDDYWEYNF